MSGHQEVVHRLLQKNANVDATTKVRTAAMSVPCARMRQAAGDPCSCGFGGGGVFPLSLTVRTSELQDGKSALYFATRGGWRPVVMLLLEKGAKPLLSPPSPPPADDDDGGRGGTSSNQQTPGD